MTTWVLVYMLCTRGCIPTHAVPYPTRQACITAQPKAEGWISVPQTYCTPLTTEEKK